jgi:1-acyl-sn-glycerol-3-phosphate acyltransferase
MLPEAGGPATEPTLRERTEKAGGRGFVSAVLWVAWFSLVVLWTPVVAAAFLTTAWWDRGRRIAGRVFRWGARVLMAMNPFWKLRVIGPRPDRRSHPLVVVSNHESLADVVLIGTLPWEMKWLSKRENFRFPFLGLMMWMAGDVSVSRDDPHSRAEAYAELGRWIDRGVSVMLFPEGTRSRTEEMLPFRSGAFRLAIETGRPVLPLVVSGSRMAIQKGSARFGNADVTIRILDPEPVDGLGMRDVQALRDRVRQRIEAARTEQA